MGGARHVPFPQSVSGNGGKVKKYLTGVQFKVIINNNLVINKILSRKNGPVCFFKKHPPMNFNQHHITKLFKHYAGL